MAYDVIVVGAGVVGALTARELARYDLKVLVLESEPDAAMGATKANSAIVHGGFAESSATLKGRLCLPGRLSFAQLEAELGFGFRVTGSLVLGFADSAARLKALYEQGVANGVPDLELWTREQVLAHEPNVNPEVQGGLWCAGAGVCSPWDLALAALENAMHNGVEVRLNQQVVAVGPPVLHGLWRLTTSDSQYDTRFVVNCAGLAGGKLDALAGITDSTLTPRSGEYLVFAPGTGALVNSVLFQLPGPLGKGVLVGPTYQGNLLLGPDARNEDGARHTHADRLRALVEQAGKVVGGLDLKKAIRSFTGVRAMASGGDFLVGPADFRAHPRWHRAVGIQSPGLTSSPALVRLLLEGMADEGLALRPRPDFDPLRSALPVHLSRRNAPLPFAQVEALTRLPPGSPERVVCRCEQVRERDLAEAYARGVPSTTIDALKRRSRAGMGWCQGRFCRPRVAEWLSAQSGHAVDPDVDVVRSGLHRVEGRELWALLEPRPHDSPQ
ncbi:MAG: NAD(P)/FAD-dependent oxidoreductase [Spirochaetales bacterium]